MTRRFWLAMTLLERALPARSSSRAVERSSPSLNSRKQTSTRFSVATARTTRPCRSATSSSRFVQIILSALLLFLQLAANVRVAASPEEYGFLGISNLERELHHGT